MPTEFVRYSPDIETIDPNLDEPLEQIIAFWEKKGLESPRTEGTGVAVRGAHAKPFGVVKAEVEIQPDVPAAYAQLSSSRATPSGAESTASRRSTCSAAVSTSSCRLFPH